MFSNKDYLDWDAPKLRKTLQQENWISKSYVAIDGEFGKEMYVYLRTKDQKFKPSKSKVTGWIGLLFWKKPVIKGWFIGVIFFLLCGCLSPAYWNGKHRVIEGMDMKEKKDEFEGGPNEPQKQDGESESVEKMAF